MAEPQRDPSVHAEPHLQGESSLPDPAEPKAEGQLKRERLRTDADQERAKHSIFDEPAILPNRQPVVIEQDWYCRNCGYNLRGLSTGHRCPECGTIERYEPPRGNEETYAKWVAARRGQVSPRKAWVVAALLPLAAIPFAVGYAFLAVEYTGPVNFVVLAPVAAEVLKVAGASMIIERRSFLIISRAQVYLITLATALVFAVVQNVVYLTLFFKGAPMELVTWRWFAGPLLHALCTAVATRGLVTVWEQTQREQRPPSITRAYPAVLTAILLHGSCNVCILAWGFLGYGF